MGIAKILILFFVFVHSAQAGFLTNEGKQAGSPSESTEANIPEESVDKYLVYLDASNPGLIRVEAELHMQDERLFMSEDGPVPERWPDYVHAMEINTASGKPVPFTFNESGDWTVQERPEPGQKLLVRYTLKVEHEKEQWPGGIDGVAFVRPWGVMVSGRALFICNGSDRGRIEVSFKKPATWKISTPWQEAEGQSDTFMVPNALQLRESLLFAGTHEDVEIVRDGFTLKFVLGGNAIMANKEKYTEMAGAVMDYYISIMGGLPKPLPGNEFSKVLVMINPSENMDGEVIGNHISLFLNPEGEMQNQVIGWFLFAHEFFHLWNGKTLSFEGTRSDWFKEGVTNYYTLKALYQVGFIDEDVIGMVLNSLFYNRYINDPGFGKLAPSDAASGFDKDNHWGIVYGGGLFAGICMDMEIRNNTANENSLDQLMRHFYEQYGGTDKQISNMDILDTANSLGETDLSPLMDSCILGPEFAPLEQYLPFAGVQVDTVNGQLRLSHLEDKSELQKKIWDGFLGNN